MHRKTATAFRKRWSLWQEAVLTGSCHQVSLKLSLHARVLMSWLVQVLWQANTRLSFSLPRGAGLRTSIPASPQLPPLATSRTQPPSHGTTPSPLTNCRWVLIPCENSHA